MASAGPSTRVFAAAVCMTVVHLAPAGPTTPELAAMSASHRRALGLSSSNHLRITPSQIAAARARSSRASTSARWRRLFGAKTQIQMGDSRSRMTVSEALCELSVTDQAAAELRTLSTLTERAPLLCCYSAAVNQHLTDESLCTPTRRLVGGGTAGCGCRLAMPHASQRSPGGGGAIHRYDVEV